MMFLKNCVSLSIIIQVQVFSSHVVERVLICVSPLASALGLLLSNRGDGSIAPFYTLIRQGQDKFDQCIINIQLLDRRAQVSRISSLA